MIFITSAAYIGVELNAELGNLPPSFLPVGNKRLFHHQHQIFEGEEQIFLSLPESYQIPECDEYYLKKLGITCLSVPDNLSLGNSILYCLNITGCHNQPVKILYGDTLIYDIDFSLTDVISVGDSDDNYEWHYVDNKGKQQVLSGYLCFSNSSEIIKSITRCVGDFLEAIDDYNDNYKSVEPLQTGHWLDFGHIHTYYRSKSFITTQRAFNEMSITPTTVTKSSYKTDVIKAESAWFSSLPQELKVYTPQFLGEKTNNGNSGYEIEFLYLSTLSELYVFGQLPMFAWRKIFFACDDFLSDCSGYSQKLSVDFSNLYYKKTIDRLNQTNIDLNSEWVINGKRTPDLLTIAKDATELIGQPSDLNQLSLIHGDFCFSNILYNFRTQSIKVIDPRGMDFNNKQSVCGDIRYDIAKLAHSVLAGYDHILAGYYKFKEVNPHNIEFNLLFDENTLQIQNIFKSMQFAGKKLEDASTYGILIHLFLSMLPLHGDDINRQKALLANALKIYTEVFDK